MKFKKIIATASLVVAGLPATARAGDGYWSEGTCTPRPNFSVQWYGMPGQGSYYSSQFGFYWVGDGFYQWFQKDMWECGFFFGVPIGDKFDLHTYSPLYQPGEWLIQDFMYARLMKRFDGEWFAVRWSDNHVFQLGRL